LRNQNKKKKMKKLASSLSSFSPYNIYSRATTLLTTIQPLSIDPLPLSFNFSLLKYHYSYHQSLSSSITKLTIPFLSSFYMINHYDHNSALMLPRATIKIELQHHIKREKEKRNNKDQNSPWPNLRSRVMVDYTMGVGRKKKKKSP